MAKRAPSRPGPPAPRLALALSGGGHRATLFSLGALLAIVDARCNDRVDAVVSVSGGSITNAVVAAACDLRSVDVGRFDEVAARIASTVVKRGLLFSALSTYAFVAGIGAVAAYLAVEALFDWPLDLPWWALLAGLAAVASVLSLRGHVLSRLLERRFLAGARPRLGDVDRPVVHAFAATDLNSGAPFFFSTAGGGTVESPVLASATCAWMPLRDAVRASAAFPGGFPPKRLALGRSGLVWTFRTAGVDDFERRFGWAGRTRRPRKEGAEAPRRLRPPRALFLADGGVWNNLGTDWVPKPLGGVDGAADPPPCVRLVVDASAPVASRRLSGLALPGLAELLAVFRTMTVLYSNTVEPRIRALDGEAAQALRRRAAGQRSWVLPVPIRVVDGREQMLRRHARISRLAEVEPGREAFRGRDGEVGKLWGWLYDRHHRIHGRGRPGLRVWNSTVATTLSRVDPETAVSLLMHGYVGTMSALHAYAGVAFPTEGRLDVSRFRRLVEGAPGSTPAMLRDEL